MNKTDNKTKFIDDFSREIFEQTYSYNGEDITSTFKRISTELASVEEDKEFWSEQFQSVLQDFKFVPGGRIVSNAGTELKGTTYINCFVSGFQGEDRDSMDSIIDELRRQALILKSEGGYGFCVDTLRPRGGFVGGIGNETPGAVRMLDMWDTQSSVITAGSGKKSKNKEAKKKIRKGAQMVTMSCWHPDIEEFITSKQTPGRLTKFNMSILITDKFMDAIKNDQPWDLVFPDYDVCKEEYKKQWDGDIKSWIEEGLPTKVYKTFDKASELWDLIMRSTYNRNEPGVLFIDTINRLNNLWYCEYINATNPCITGDVIVETSKGNIKLIDLVKRVNNGENIDVLTYNIEKQLIENKKVNSGCLTKKNTKILEVELEDGTKLKLTPDHQLFIKNKGWTRADKITEDDIVLKIDGTKQ